MFLSWGQPEGMKGHSLFFLFAIVSCVGCNRQEDQVLPEACIQSTQLPGPYLSTDFTEVDYDQHHCGYLPLGKNNYWVYRDSIFNNSAQLQSVVQDTFRFTKTFRTPDGIIWWAQDMSASTPNIWPGYPPYNYSTDSTLYGTKQNWGSRAGVKWFYGIGNNTSLSEIIDYSDLTSPCYAERLVNPVSSPAGTFSDCLLFTKKNVYGTAIDYSTWYKPGIGVIRNYVYAGTSAPVRISTLISYHFE